MTAAGTHVLLLRGINVGGKNLLPMKDLTALVSGLGCAEVKTYIQSGNVVVRADDRTAARLPARLSEAIAAHSGLKVPVVMRSAARLAELVRANPFIAAGDDPDTLHLAFLADAPAADRVARLDPQRSPPDRFVVQGSEVYLCYPNGLGRSKLSTDYLDRTLGTVSTTRNWRTVLKLLEMSNVG